MTLRGGVGRQRGVDVRQAPREVRVAQIQGSGLHSSTFQLNLSQYADFGILLVALSADVCPHLRMGIQPDAHFSARCADALPATLYGHLTLAIYRNWRMMTQKHIQKNP